MALVESKSDTYRVAVTLLDIFFQFFPAVTSYAQELETMVKREFNMPRISKRVHAIPLNLENQRERFSALSRLTRMMFCTGT